MTLLLVPWGCIEGGAVGRSWVGDQAEGTIEQRFQATAGASIVSIRSSVLANGIPGRMFLSGTFR